MKKLIMVYLSSILVSSCCLFASYEGQYDLSKSAVFKAPKFSEDIIKNISLEIQNIAEKFGFVTDCPNFRCDANYFVFHKLPKTVPIGFESFNGVNENIVLILDLRSVPPVIYLNSYSRNETDFVFALKCEIEQNMKKHIDMKKVKFKRIVNVL